MAPTAANAEMVEYWNRGAGPAWVRHQERLDEQLRALGELGLQRAAPTPGEAALDVGCGCGASALALAARVGPRGRVVGVDVSVPMLARARERAAAAGLADRIEWVLGDAQTLALGRAGYDCAYSRFGVMFFDDPRAAFGNLASALRPGGRLAFLCWQGRERNPWMMAPLLAAAAHVELPPPPPPDAPGPFAFADEGRVRGILTSAGFAEIGFESVERPLALGGGTVDDAVELFLEVGPPGQILRERPLSADRREAVVAAVRRALEAFAGSEGVRAPSAAWIVTARRPRA